MKNFDYHMLNIKISPQYITIILVVLSLLPRLLTPVALSNGTLCVVLFWIAMFVLFPEFVDGYESKKIAIKDLTFFTKLTTIFLTLCFILVLLYKDILFADQNIALSLIRKSIYLSAPSICLIWWPNVFDNRKLEFLRLIGFLTLIMGLTILLPKLLEKSWFILKLNEITSFLSGSMLSVIIEEKISVEREFFIGESFSIEVRSGCSALPQILVTKFSLAVLYVCCKLKSFKKLLCVLMLSTSIAFLINSLRVSILGYIVYKNKMNYFKFWHDGAGSLIFALITMSLSCTIYYFFWDRENSI